MAEETTTQAVQDEVSQDTDWQAKYEEMRGHMRDWEKKAKANQSAADELEKLRAAQMTEQEKERARADAAEAELNALRAENERHAAAREIASQTGVPIDLLLYCADADAMTDFAKKYQAEQPVIHAAAKANASRVLRGGGEKSNADIFADVVNDLFK